MAIIKLKPAGKDYIWGGTKLIDEYHKEYAKTPMAESWELSCHPAGPCVVDSGPCKGLSFPRYLERKGMEILGHYCASFSEFPILVKFIDAKENLSVQVHPDDAYALQHEKQYGKTEVWYVVDCEEGAFIYLGMEKEVTKEAFVEAVLNEHVEPLLHKVYIHPGDVFFIYPGTLHAIGGGSLIAEIQQNSDITYRVYDYGRVDADGRPRNLHIQQALDVTNLTPVYTARVGEDCLADCDYFTVEKKEIAGLFQSQVGAGSFLSILVLSGCGTIQCTETLPFQKGECFFLEAGAGDFEITGNGTVLLIHVKERKQTHTEMR